MWAPITEGVATYVICVIRPTASYLYIADGTKVQAIGATGQVYEYLGSLRLSVNGSNVNIESIPFAGGRIVKTTNVFVKPDKQSEVYFGFAAARKGRMKFNGYEPQYYITDHLGSTRTIVKPKATVVAEFDYMPYGTQHIVAEAPTAEADYKYTGKEQQGAFGMYSLYDSQARFQYVKDGIFLSHDPLYGNFSDISPYMYCGGDPINRVDQDGRAWFSYIDTNGNEQYEYTGQTREKFFIEILRQFIEDDTIFRYFGNKYSSVQYHGDVVVVFNGSMKEKLGKGNYLNGEGAITANVTVYGPNGPEDIAHYTGFTMTSNYEKFGEIADGEYYVSHVTTGSGNIPKTHIINNGDPVNCINDNNPSPAEYYPYSPTQKDRIYIHRTNNNGFAGDNPVKKKAVSSGCLLILAADWEDYDNQIGGRDYKVILKRTL